MSAIGLLADAIEAKRTDLGMQKDTIKGLRRNLELAIAAHDFEVDELAALEVAYAAVNAAQPNAEEHVELAAAEVVDQLADLDNLVKKEF